VFQEAAPHLVGNLRYRLKIIPPKVSDWLVQESVDGLRDDQAPVRDENAPGSGQGIGFLRYVEQDRAHGDQLHRVVCNAIEPTGVGGQERSIRAVHEVAGHPFEDARILICEHNDAIIPDALQQGPTNEPVTAANVQDTCSADVAALSHDTIAHRVK
jgi:hypothetical protein